MTVISLVAHLILGQVLPVTGLYLNCINNPEYWPGSFHVNNDPSAPHEANFLHLQIDKSHHLLNWHPVWDYSTTVRRTVEWYRSVNEGACPIQCCFIDLNEYIKSSFSNP